MEHVKTLCYPMFPIFCQDGKILFGDLAIISSRLRDHTVCSGLDMYSMVSREREGARADCNTTCQGSGQYGHQIGSSMSWLPTDFSAVLALRVLQYISILYKTKHVCLHMTQ